MGLHGSKTGMMFNMNRGRRIKCVNCGGIYYKGSRTSNAHEEGRCKELENNTNAVFDRMREILHG